MLRSFLFVGTANFSRARAETADDRIYPAFFADDLPLLVPFPGENRARNSSSAVLCKNLYS
jgi:hypothetical protein